MDCLSRAMAYLDKLPPAISGAGGHNATLRAACECFRFGLSEDEAFQAMQWFNDFRCQPKWSEGELHHKVNDAEKIVRASGGYNARGVMRHTRKSRTFIPPQRAIKA